MLSLRERLLVAEHDFLVAVSAGTDAIDNFGSQWDLILEELNVAMQSSDADADILRLAADVSFRIEICASTFQDVLGAAESIETNMEDELQAVFAELSLNDVVEDEFSFLASFDEPPAFPRFADVFPTIRFGAYDGFMVANM